MTVLGWTLRLVDKHTRFKKHPGYRAFQESYQGSRSQSHANSLLTIAWIISLVILNATPIYLPSYEQLGQNLFLVLVGTSIAYSLVISPSWFYYREGPFLFNLSWYPITTRRSPLRKSHQDKLHLDLEKPEKIVVYTAVPGKVDGYDFKLVSSHEKIRFEATPDLPLSQEPYSDDTGVYSEKEVEDDFITNIFEVQKEEPLRGDHSHYLKIIEVSNIDEYEHSSDIPKDRAETDGDTILVIEVSE